MCGSPVAMGFSKISLFLSLINCIKMVYLAVKIQKILRSLLSFYSAPLVVPRWLTELVPFLCAVIKYMDFKVTISSCITFFYYCFSECCAIFRCSKQFFLYLSFLSYRSRYINKAISISEISIRSFHITGHALFYKTLFP